MDEGRGRRKAQGSVLVIAVIDILLGAFGLLSGVAAMAMPLMAELLKHLAASSGARLPPLAALSHPVFVVTGALTFVVGLLYVVAGILLLLLKPAGRQLAIAAAAAEVVVWLTNTALHLLVMQPLLHKMGAGQPLVLTIFSLLVGALFGLVYPIAVIVLLRRPEARAQFDEPA